MRPCRPAARSLPVSSGRWACVFGGGSAQARPPGRGSLGVRVLNPPTQLPLRGPMPVHPSINPGPPQPASAPRSRKGAEPTAPVLALGAGLAGAGLVTSPLWQSSPVPPEPRIPAPPSSSRLPRRSCRQQPSRLPCRQRESAGDVRVPPQKSTCARTRLQAKKLDDRAHHVGREGGRGGRVEGGRKGRGGGVGEAGREKESEGQTRPLNRRLLRRSRRPPPRAQSRPRDSECHRLNVFKLSISKSALRVPGTVICTRTERA